MTDKTSSSSSDVGNIAKVNKTAQQVGLTDIGESEAMPDAVVDISMPRLESANERKH